MKKLILTIALLIPSLSYGLGFDYFERRGNCGVWKLMNYFSNQFLTLEYSKDGIQFTTIDSPAISYDISAVRLYRNGFYRVVLQDSAGYRLCSPVLKATGLERAVMPLEVIYQTNQYQLTSDKELKLL